MGNIFADRMSTVHKSFIREILKVTEDPEIISFAGGLPNPASFPVKAVSDAAIKVLKESGESALQYSTTEGHYPLRQYISERYAKKGVEVTPENIMIISGSQQGLDLIAKIMIDKGDKILVERPTYLAALQSFGMFQPEFRSVTLNEDGVDTAMLEKELNENRIKLFYSVPNFQNPTGITYSRQKREEVARIMQSHDTIFVEDNPYGEIRFMGEDQPSMKTYLKEKTILLGSFSKIVSPGMRLGWICAEKDIMDKLVTAKQASDLHTNYFTQRVVYQYLIDNDVESHIQMIRGLYKKQRDCMVSMIEKYFPGDVKITRPEGGMFIWATLPEGISSMELFDIAIKEKVAFVPGRAFFADGTGDNTMRLNYSSSSEDRIEEGVKRLGLSIERLLAN
ncbi:aspartate aminotransferase [Methanocella sp. CWC-04]|uniref:Aspartate aminotransferase n=1 Tax=Methanooceanicella nereidis TaxID=2052831 RepID=A0AAP2RE69_9EURY|nr:PLP-dependent aminotransferase family protein [Methanocella sp. CWC-04]MCD1295146.1 aspartate aminotransferase [Methanocella sp. CWC-04]